MPAHSDEELEAIQVVVDRVSSYQDGAPEGTVEHELTDGLSEAGVEVSKEDVARLAGAIEERHGAVDARSVLG
ncbi:hypothetical protein [Nocardioides halotolerans]|jgi:hypothetical protein|uniref:hypothetical protein n=1 Tax=Nocardioides halotolerans TaxID=433660 RepID=UPI00048D9B07|nr:hypothetical protein [Nocardioides halotolerans]